MRDRITTWLDLVAALILVIAAALAVYGVEAWQLARSAAVAGVGLLIVSWLLSGAPLPWKRGR